MDDEIVGTVATGVEPERSLTQEHVNEIVKREKAAAADKVRREMEVLHRNEIEQLKSSAPTSMGGIPQEDLGAMEERLLKRMAEEQERKQNEILRAENEQLLRNAADMYHLKVAKGKDKFSDFEEVMRDFDPSAFPQVALEAADFDNTDEIMYELSKNPGKLMQLTGLFEKSPLLGRRELTKLSQSIVQNQEAKENNVSTNAPLSRLKSSTVGEDSGQVTLKDLKNADWLRG